MPNQCFACLCQRHEELKSSPEKRRFVWYSEKRSLFGWIVYLAVFLMFLVIMRSVLQPYHWNTSPPIVAEIVYILITLALWHYLIEPLFNHLVHRRKPSKQSAAKVDSPEQRRSRIRQWLEESTFFNLFLG